MWWETKGINLPLTRRLADFFLSRIVKTDFSLCPADYLSISNSCLAVKKQYNHRIFAVNNLHIYRIAQWLIGSNGNLYLRTSKLDRFYLG